MAAKRDVVATLPKRGAGAAEASALGVPKRPPPIPPPPIPAPVSPLAFPKRPAPPPPREGAALLEPPKRPPVEGVEVAGKRLAPPLVVVAFASPPPKRFSGAFSVEVGKRGLDAVSEDPKRVVPDLSLGGAKRLGRAEGPVPVPVAAFAAGAPKRSFGVSVAAEVPNPVKAFLAGRSSSSFFSASVTVLLGNSVAATPVSFKVRFPPMMLARPVEAAAEDDNAGEEKRPPLEAPNVGVVVVFVVREVAEAVVLGPDSEGAEAVGVPKSPVGAEVVVLTVEALSRAGAEEGKGNVAETVVEVGGGGGKLRVVADAEGAEEEDEEEERLAVEVARGSVAEGSGIPKLGVDEVKDGFGVMIFVSVRASSLKVTVFLALSSSTDVLEEGCGGGGAGVGAANEMGLKEVPGRGLWQQRQDGDEDGLDTKQVVQLQSGPDFFADSAALA